MRTGGLIGLALLMSALLTGCEEEGPAEKAGKKIDRTLDKLSDKGPAEKAGERIDEAVEELKKK